MEQKSIYELLFDHQEARDFAYVVAKHGFTLADKDIQKGMGYKLFFVAEEISGEDFQRFVSITKPVVSRESAEGTPRCVECGGLTRCLCPACQEGLCVECQEAITKGDFPAEAYRGQNVSGFCLDCRDEAISYQWLMDWQKLPKEKR